MDNTMFYLVSLFMKLILFKGVIAFENFDYQDFAKERSLTNFDYDEFLKADIEPIKQTKSRKRLSSSKNKDIQTPPVENWDTDYNPYDNYGDYNYGLYEDNHQDDQIEEDQKFEDEVVKENEQTKTTDKPTEPAMIVYNDNNYYNYVYDEDDELKSENIKEMTTKKAVTTQYSREVETSTNKHTVILKPLRSTLKSWTKFTTTQNKKTTNLKGENMTPIPVPLYPEIQITTTNSIIPKITEISQQSTTNVGNKSVKESERVEINNTTITLASQTSTRNVVSSTAPTTQKLEKNFEINFDLRNIEIPVLKEQPITHVNQKLEPTSSSIDKLTTPAIKTTTDNTRQKFNIEITEPIPQQEATREKDLKHQLDKETKKVLVNNNFGIFGQGQNINQEDELKSEPELYPESDLESDPEPESEPESDPEPHITALRQFLEKHIGGKHPIATFGIIVAVFMIVLVGCSLCMYPFCRRKIKHRQLENRRKNTYGRGTVVKAVPGNYVAVRMVPNENDHYQNKGSGIYCPTSCKNRQM